MSDTNTAEYYSKRAVDERTLAEKSTDPAVRTIHMLMAEDYERMAREEAPPQLRAIPSS